MHVALLTLLLLTTGPQETDPDAQYRLEFERYEAIAAVEDPAERATAFMDFADEGFDERLAGSVLGGTQEGIEAVAASGDLDTLYNLADRWDAQTGQMTGSIIALQSAIGASDHEAIVRYGDPFYETNPIVDIAEVLAVSHDALGNTDRFIEYANVVIGEKGIADAFNFAEVMYGRDLNASDWEGAAEWARQFRALSSAPAGVSPGDWNTMQIEFQRTIARAEYEAGRFENAVSEYQTLAGMDPGQRAYAWFNMGRAYFEMGSPADISLALERFADAAVVDDPNVSPAALNMVQEIYRANTGDTLEGLDENVMNAARERVGP